MSAVGGLRCFLNLEKGSEVMHKLVENKVREQLVLHLSWQLVKHLFLLIIIDSL